MVFSCNHNNERDTQKPIITIEEPAANDTSSVSLNKVHVEFVVSDNDKLQQVHVSVAAPSWPPVFAANPGVAGMSTFLFHEHFIPTAAGVSQLLLTVTAVDAHSNSVILHQEVIVALYHIVQTMPG